MSETRKWLSVYLYYAEPWEKFLIEAVHPFVESVFKEGLAEQFFFIRYWERGPHIRLRFKGEADILEGVLKPRLESYFENYISENFSFRTEPDWVRNLPEGQEWFSNNSTQFVEYEPEIRRYGGPVGILIAERQFELSSRSVFSILRESNSWDYDRALGAAIQMHLSFANAMGMTLHETAQFYSLVSKGWLMSAIGYRKDMTVEDLEKRKEMILNAFKENFEKQRTTLVSFHNTLWNALCDGCEFEQGWLNSWREKTAQIAETINRAQANHELILGMEPYSELHPEISVSLSSILESYVHMTNNRLGILNHDEAYLGYLITHSLIALDSKDSGENKDAPTAGNIHG